MTIETVFTLLACAAWPWARLSHTAPQRRSPTRALIQRLQEYRCLLRVANISHISMLRARGSFHSVCQVLAKLWCILLTKPGKRNAILRLLDFVKAFSARALQRLKLSCHALCVGHEGSALLDGLHCFWTFEANSTLVNISAYNSRHCCYLYKSTSLQPCVGHMILHWQDVQKQTSVP